MFCKTSYDLFWFDHLADIPWKGILLPKANLLEFFVRGSIVYLALVFLLRTIQKRHVGMLGSADFIFVLLLAVSTHYALTGAEKSIIGALTIILTLIFWNYVINFLSYRFKSFKSFIHPPPLPLVQNGRILRQNMQKEFITEEELYSELRKQGIKSLENIEDAHIEPDGQISVILKNRRQLTNEGKKII